MGFATRGRILATALLLLVAAACGSREDGEPATAPVSAAGETSGDPTAGPSSREAAPTEQEIRAAMLAVYARVVGLPESERPQRWQPISLENAAAILQRDAAASVFGESRRRRAIVRLTVAGLKVHDDRTFEHTYRSFLEAVDAPLANIDAVIERNLRAAGAMELDLERLSADLFKGLTTMSLAGWCADLYPPEPDPSPPAVNPASCPQHGTDSSWKNNTPSTRVTLYVKRSLKDLSRALDPQSWDEHDAGPNKTLCNKWFKWACALQENDPDFKYCERCPLPLGSSWHRFFQESFEMGIPGGSTSEFDVILDVTTDYADPHYRADFCLTKCLYCKTGNTSNGTIDIDEGFSDVSNFGPGVQRLTAEKYLHFSGYGDWQDIWFNDQAKSLLKGMLEGLQEQACCTPEDPDCGGNPIDEPPGSAPPTGGPPAPPPLLP